MKLFVVRNSYPYRKIKNNVEMEKFLASLGFLVIEPEKMPFAEQVLLFARAKVVVGIMGASMTNTIFCDEGTPCIYLAPSGWIENFYWDLSGVMSLGYHVIYGRTENVAGHPYMADFEVDPRELGHVLRNI